MSQQHKVEVTMKALEAFLEPRPPRKLEGQEAIARLREAFRDEELPMPLEEDAPHRILVMWRICRVLARLTGLCAEDESLDNATELAESPWTEQFKPMLSPSQQDVMRRSQASTVLVEIGPGISLLPPTDREHAKRWCAAVSEIARDLNITGTERGLRGMRGLLHHQTAMHAGVTPKQVLAMEDLLVDEAQDVIVDCGERAAIKHIRDEYGFGRNEAIGLIRLARADALATGGSSVEEDRAIMVAQLKDLVGRAKEEMNIDKELKALKQLAAIQGLTRTDPENLAKDFMQVIAQVAGRQDAALEAPRALEPRTVDAVAFEHPVEYDEDAEALEAFDKENPR